MRKGVSYLIIAIIIALGIVVLYYWGGGPTGYAIFSEYENQTACEDAGYIWENLTEQNCTDIPDCVVCEEGCVTEYTEVLCEEGCQETCAENETECVECIEGCVTEYTEVLCEEGCQETCQECVEIVIGGQCIGDVCSADFLELCLNETDCTDAGGYWYNETCNAEEPSCSTDLSLCEDEESCEDIGGGYWYDDTCNTEEEEIEEPEEIEEEIEEPIIPLFSFSEIHPLYLNPEGSQESSVIIKNTGEIPLPGCVLKLIGGEFDSWISVSEEIININPNQEHAFSFSVTIPEGTAEDSYSLKIATQCLNIYQAHNFVVNVVEKKLEFGLISADRIRDDRVRVVYSLQELSGENQDVELGFSLLNENNQEVATASENQSIEANALQEFSVDIGINESLLPVNETTNETMESSELTLVVDFNSQIYSSSVSERITLGAPIGGFAIFAGIGAGEAIIFVVVLFVLIFIFVFARRMRKRGKTLKDLFKKAPGEGPQ